MHLHELKVEGTGVTVRPAWHDKIESEMRHLEAQHRGAFSRLTIRFRPVQPGPGVSVDIDGCVHQHSFKVHDEGKNVLAVIHHAFLLIRRMLERTEPGRHRPGLPAVELDPLADTVEEMPEENADEMWEQPGAAELEASTAAAGEDMASEGGTVGRATT